MIKQVIIGIIVGIVVNIVVLVFKAFVPHAKIVEKLTNRYVFTIVRYILAILLIALCWLLIPFNEWFVLSIVILVGFIVLMICYDYFDYKIAGFLKITNSVLRENELKKSENYRKMLYQDLERCESKESRTRIIEKIKKLDKGQSV